jgi:fucose 4-O-acetylase-like acetyltransferase
MEGLKTTASPLSFFRSASAAGGNRNAYIDALKGITIILVVVAHAIQRNDPVYDSNILFRVIFSFQMPMFMFLSGLVISYAREKSTIDYIGRNFLRLVVPFLSWYMLGYFLSGAFYTTDFLTYWLALVKETAVGLWFLWALFINSIILFPIIKVSEAKKIGIWEVPLIIAAVLIIRSTSSDMLGLPEVRSYLPYYVGGYFTYRYWDKLKEYKSYIQYSSLPVFPLLVAVWMRNDVPLFYPALLQALGSERVTHVILSVYKYAVCLSGIVFTSFIVEKIREGRVYKFLCWLGMLTMDIYVSHGYFLIAVGNETTRIITASLLGLLMPVLLSLFVLRRNRILSVLFLGLDQKKS